MSSFNDSTPALQVRIENPLLGRAYPDQDRSLAVLDTGFSGFVAVPSDVFGALGLDELEVEERVLTAANGEKVRSKVTMARLTVYDASTVVDGYIETWDGLDEILVGSEALGAFRLEIDYCLRRLSVQKCGALRRPLSWRRTRTPRPGVAF